MVTVEDVVAEMRVRPQRVSKSLHRKNATIAEIAKPSHTSIPPRSHLPAMTAEAMATRPTPAPTR